MVEVDVGDDGHAAVPGVRRVEPPAEAHLDEGDVDRLLGEPEEDDRGQDLELGRVAEPAADAIRDRQHLPDEPGEGPRIHRPAVDLEPLAVRDEVRLGRLAGAEPGGRRALPASASTLPLPFVPATSAPRNDRCGSPRSRRIARVRPSPRRIPNRPRAWTAGQRLGVGEGAPLASRRP